MNNNINNTKQLQIRQQNVNKSLMAVLDLLNSALPEKFDIITIQEPYIDFLGNARANPKWYTVYPKTYYSDKERCIQSMILVNKKIATDAWSIINIRSPDITAIKLKTPTRAVLIINLYCDCSHSKSINKLNQYKCDATQDGITDMILYG